MRTAVIYEGPVGTRVQTDEVVIIGTSGEGLLQVAREQAQAGADRIELCGGVSARVYAAVKADLGPGVEVGLNRYEFDSLEAIADYKTAFGNGEKTTEMFLYRAEGADPARDRVTHGGTTFVAVPDDAAVGHVVTELLGKPHTLIELYAGLGAGAAAAALDATGAAVPVGFVGYDVG